MLLPARFDPRRFGTTANTNSVWWHWLVNVVAASPAIGRGGRSRLLALAGIEVGTALIEPGCFFFGRSVSLGPWAWINHRCYFDARDQITVGASCSLGMEVMLCTSTHELGGAEKRAGRYSSGPVAIGDGTWLGTRVLVLPGVTIGPSCVVAAGSVVTRDLEPHGLYAGAPARRIRGMPEAPGQAA